MECISHCVADQITYSIFAVDNHANDKLWVVLPRGEMESVATGWWCHMSCPSSGLEISLHHISSSQKASPIPGHPRDSTLPIRPWEGTRPIPLTDGNINQLVLSRTQSYWSHIKKWLWFKVKTSCYSGLYVLTHFRAICFFVWGDGDLIQSDTPSSWHRKCSYSGTLGAQWLPCRVHKRLFYLSLLFGTIWSV